MEPTTTWTPMTPSARLWKLQVNWALQMVHRIPGRTSQGSRSPRSGADIRYRHIPEIGEQSRTIQLAHVHGRKPKNSGDIYNVRTGGGGGQGYPPRRSFAWPAYEEEHAVCLSASPSTRPPIPSEVDSIRCVWCVWRFSSTSRAQLGPSHPMA